MDIDNFEKAFTSSIGSCRATCVCGKEYYNGDDGWDFEDGELEKLDADPEATPLNYSVSYVCFEGRQFVADCECWKVRANLVMNFIDGHAHEIAEYLSLEKKRKQLEAKDAPVVDEAP